jgi:hypothetical protein
MAVAAKTPWNVMTQFLRAFTLRHACPLAGWKLDATKRSRALRR